MFIHKAFGNFRSIFYLLFIALLIVATENSYSAQANPGYYLSGPNNGDPVAIAFNYLRNNKRALGLSSSDIANAVITDQYTSAHNNVTHIYLRQRYHGFEVHNANININIASDGSVMNLGNRFLPGIETAINTTAPSLTLGEAVSSAARSLGLNPSKGVISRKPIMGKLVYQPVAKNLAHLAWNLEIYEQDAQNWWSMRIDALTGAVLDQSNYVVHDNYTVYPEPVESPNHGSRDNIDFSLSGSGWVDAQSQCTKGNNVDAYLDTNASNSPTGGDSARACGGSSLNFNFSIDLFQEPDQYPDAAVTNLFYWNNLIHDVFYLYGFDEVSGNFQEDNGGNAGAGNDSVQAEAQDGAGLNNANFATPADGSKPRMQMFLWDQTSPMRDGDLDNGIIAHEYGHGISNRLTGGPGTASCLFNTEQAGEGWSDYFGLWLTMVEGDQPVYRRGVGTYALGQPTDGTGIRDFPYSTNMSIDPRTYDTIKSAAVPHGVGSTWAAMLWEMTWALIGTHGFDSDLHYGSGGNNIALQLVVDGLKLQPCSPGFVDARDAILLADLNNNGGANQCLIWTAFAKRGLGYSADQGSTSSRTDGTEAFDLPLACQQVLSITTTASPSPVEAGQALTYSLQVENRTDTTLTNVTITDNIPEHISYTSATCSGSESGGVVSFPLGTMNTGESITCSFQVSVSELTASPILSDNMESGSALWTASHGSGSVDWTLGTANPHSPSSAWFAQDIATSSDQYLALTNPVAISGDALLSFWHQYDTESDWDGGVVEISSNGGSWVDLGALMFQNGYNSTINANPASAIENRRAYSGTNGGYTQTLVDLGGYANDTVRIRFRMATDGLVAGLGWDLDDVKILDDAVLFNEACVTANEGDNDCSVVLTAVTPVPLPPAPRIVVSPASLSSTQFWDEVTNQTLNITNTGSANLNWNIETDSAGTCTLPDNSLSWAIVSPLNGATLPSQNTDITVDFNSNGLAAGHYTGALCVSSNDSENTLVSVDLSLIVNDPDATVVQRATGEIQVKGSVISGSYIDTHTDDGSYQELGELHQGGKPQSRWDELEHIWTFTLQNGTGLTFNASANALFSFPSDGDEFLWFYSSDNINWTWLYSLDSTNNGNTIIEPLPDNLTGNFYIKLRTSDQTSGNNSNDFISVYYLSVTEGGASTPNPPIEMTVSDLVGSAALGRRNRWDATVTAIIVDTSVLVSPVAGAVISGSWSNGGSDSCTTNSSGQCSMTKPNIKLSVSPVTFQVTDVSRGVDDYIPGDTTDEVIYHP